MTAWSLLTASDDPTSHSSPTPPVGQPNMQISNIPRVPPSFPLSIRLHSQKGPSLLSLVLPPALSAQAPPPRRMSQSASRFCCCCLTGWRKCETKTKINVLLLGGLWRLTMEITLPCISWLLCCIQEQASIHHNEWGNVAMHKLGYSHNSMNFLLF